VAGFVGEQFALPEAVELLRRVKNTEPTGQLVAVSACDPLNVVGILTPGERVPAILGNRVVFRDGVPLVSLEGGNLTHRASVDEATLLQIHSLLHPALLQRAARPTVASPAS
jgi:ATP-dependent Lhr-like helicase